jgi:NADH dehydrogenase
MARSRVVIIGAGFGGLSAARALRKAEADVLVIDRHNCHLFQPLLYQVASATPWLRSETDGRRPPELSST